VQRRQSTDMQVLHFFLDKICNLSTYHVSFYSPNRRKVINSQKQSSFWCIL